MFKKILIANRGEIALRVIRACHELGIKTVAIYSTADEYSLHVKFADEAVCIGPPLSSESYLNIPRIIAAGEITNSDAIHPGYGFLSESAEFSKICSENGFTFIGPGPEMIMSMGDKATAKKTMKSAGVPVIPGGEGILSNIDEAKTLARKMGYPVMLKATAGGGGRGMKVANNQHELSNAFSSARSEAKAAFGNDEVYIEKYLTTPRHIEIQVFGDGKGNAVHLGERDCSLQRRHQKILEESPGPTITNQVREKIGKICSDAIASIHYAGAGTIEFLYENNEFYFIEMNTRLQVEHPVTEAVYGVDLVREQIRVAAGLEMSLKQNELKPSGHAIEARINAETLPNFIPSPGTITAFHSPGGLGVRMDSHLYNGYTIPPFYDSLIGKLIVHGRDRTEAIERLRRSLDEIIIDGIETTTELFNLLLNEPDIKNGDYNIHWLEEWLVKREE